MVCNCPHHPHSTRISIARQYDTHEKQLKAFIDSDDPNGVKRKLAAGARVNGCKKEEYHPIITAVREGNVAITKLLLKEGANLDSALPKGEHNSNGDLVHAAGTRPLHFAARQLDLDVFRVLMRAGAPLNTPDANGMTPLMMAFVDLSQTRTVMVRELLEAGADLILRDGQGWTILHFAAALEDPEPLKMLTLEVPEAIK